MVIPATSTEYVHIPVTVTPSEGVDDVPPMIAFLPASNRANPEPSDWLTGEWHAGIARILIGPDGGLVELDQGIWEVWIRLDPPGAEQVVRHAGPLVVT